MLGHMERCELLLMVLGYGGLLYRSGSPGRYKGKMFSLYFFTRAIFIKYARFGYSWPKGDYIFKEVT